jgi:hypothetical protein
LWYSRRLVQLTLNNLAMDGWYVTLQIVFRKLLGVGWISLVSGFDIIFKALLINICDIVLGRRTPVSFIFYYGLMIGFNIYLSVKATNNFQTVLSEISYSECNIKKQIWSFCSGKQVTVGFVTPCVICMLHCVSSSFVMAMTSKLLRLTLISSCKRVHCFFGMMSVLLLAVGLVYEYDWVAIWEDIDSCLPPFAVYKYYS